MGFLQQITWWLEAYPCILESRFCKMTANSCFLICSNCFYPSMVLSMRYMKTSCSLLKSDWQTWTGKGFKVGSRFVIRKGADLFLNPKWVVVLFTFEGLWQKPLLGVVALLLSNLCSLVSPTAPFSNVWCLFPALLRLVIIAVVY